jgi:phenylacetic acid degradation operon negative regulatory protein
LCDIEAIGHTAPVPRRTLAARRQAVADLVEPTRPLTARSVLASSLLGATEPVLAVAALVTSAALFGISSGAVRTCLWRMVANGELTAEDGSYRLAGPLLERRRRVDDAARPAYVSPHPWDGTWELAVVAPGGRSAVERLELRRAAAALHLAELREGTWTRPDNLDPQRLPSSRAVVAEQCVQFRHATAELAAHDVAALFDLSGWAAVARRLIDAIDDELDAGPPRDAVTDVLTFRFLLSVAVVRHLQLDAHLPAELLPADWPAERLRADYRRYDAAFKRDLAAAGRAARGSS